MRVPYRAQRRFLGAALSQLWQWNHVPVDGKWSLTERPGFLRLHALPATDFWDARNTPHAARHRAAIDADASCLDAAGLQPGDVAGLALLNLPYAALGVERTARRPAPGAASTSSAARRCTCALDLHGAAQRVWLRADCDFLTEQARFAYSPTAAHFAPIGNRSRWSSRPSPSRAFATPVQLQHGGSARAAGSISTRSTSTSRTRAA